MAGRLRENHAVHLHHEVGMLRPAVSAGGSSGSSAADGKAASRIEKPIAAV